MRTIGLLGGMSWESSIEYERIIHEMVRAELGGTHSARMLVWTPDFADVEALQEAGDWPALGRMLGGATAGLVGAGAEVLAIATNTMHKVADDVVAAALGMPLVHLGDVVADAARAAGASRLGLLGTSYTMEQPFLRDRIAALHGADVVVPGPDDRDRVHRVIFDELVRGQVVDTSRTALEQVEARLLADGCDAIVLGCTELELLLDADDGPAPRLATPRLHARAIAAAALVD